MDNSASPDLPKQLGGVLPRRLFPRDNTSRMRSLSDSPDTFWPSATSKPSSFIPSDFVPSGLVQQPTQGPAQETASVLEKVGQKYGWSPLRAAQSSFSPGRDHAPNTKEASFMTPMRSSASRIEVLRAAARTPVSPKITSPPDIHLSHKKEKAGTGNSFRANRRAPVQKDGEADDLSWVNHK